MKNDSDILHNAREDIKNSSREFCFIYSELAGENVGDKIRSTLDAQLRISKKLAQLQNLYASNTTNIAYPKTEEVSAFKKMAKK